MAQLAVGLAMMIGGLFVISVDLDSGDTVNSYSNAKFKSISDAQLSARTRSGDDFVVVGFAPWCIACKRFAPVFAEAKAKLGDRLTAYNADAGKAVDVGVFPTIIRYKGGREVDRHEGSMSLEALVAFSTK
jgi:thiol-disulfide isomerase/thioredoxin